MSANLMRGDGEGSALAASLTAGAAGGAGGALVFVTLHALWIVPVWEILAVALPTAAMFGLAVGWAYEELLARRCLPPEPFAGIVFVGVLLSTLIPVAALTALTGPVSQINVAVVTVVTPLLATFPTGVLIGRLLSGAWRPALSVGLAALLLGISIGRNLPFFPIGSRGAPVAFALVVLVEGAAGVVLMAVRSFLAARAPDYRPGPG